MPTRARSCVPRCSILRFNSNRASGGRDEPSPIPAYRRARCRSCTSRPARWACRGAGQAALAATAPAANYRKLLVLVELKGGNDGLNTVVPYVDPAYYALRPRIAIARDQVVQLSDRAGCIPRWRHCTRCGQSASSPSCRASATASPTCRTSVPSRSGTLRARATRCSRKAGSRAPSRARRHRRDLPRMA